jgi:selenide, water dikinase
MAVAPNRPRLTELSHGAGCACKIGAAELREIRAGLPTFSDPSLLVGLDPADDAAVYKLSDELALVQTLDFFTPIVDDPRDFGRIAATNALSDVYAMGARPVLALNIVAFSLERLGGEVLAEILAGGAEVAAAAGVAIGGGHSIEDPEPKYGMAVSGVVHPDELLTAAGAQPGDELHLTKPVGGGLITTAAKRGIAEPEWVEAAIEAMTTLNAEAAEAARAVGAHALTDVTGFGLLGHLHKMARASGVTAVIDTNAVPYLEGARAAARDGFVSGGTHRNLAWVRAHLDSASYDDIDLLLLADAQTSGGLLVAGELPGAPVIGELVPARADGITLVLR